jgi:serine/threonine protein phosphatase 1
MKSERVFIIGDVHGCLDMLLRLAEKVAWLPQDDTIIFLGDYIDRGEDPKGVVDYIISLRKNSFRVKCLLGNHEAMFLDYLSGKNMFLYLSNGGTATLRSYKYGRTMGIDSLIPPAHMDFYHSLEMYIELNDCFIVHAGFRPGVKIKDQSTEDMIWIRAPFIYSDYDFGKKVIFGHTPFPEPLIMENKIGLDTGAFLGNKLTCLELPGMNFYSVKP